MDFGDSCPEEILRLILSYIDCRQSQCQASLVCRRWHRLMTDPSTHLGDDLDTIELRQNQLPEIGSNFGGGLANSPRVRLDSIDSLASYPNYVGSCDRLILHWTNSDNFLGQLELLQPLNSRIRHLVLGVHDRVGTDTLIIDRYFPNLEKLELIGYSFMTNDHPIDHMSNLKSVRFCSIRPTANVSSNVKFLEYKVSSGGLVDTEFLNLLPSYSGLTELVFGISRVDEIFMHRFMLIIRDDLPHLTAFTLDGVSLFTTDPMGGTTYQSITLPPPNHERKCCLKFLGYLYCGPFRINELLSIFIRLLGLKLETVSVALTAYTSPGLEDIYKLIRAVYVQNCNLDLRLEDGANRCDLFEPPPPELTVILRKLELVRVDSQQYIDYLFQSDTYQKLVNLSFVRCCGIQTSTLEKIAQLCVRLQSLELVHCKNLSGSGLLEFLKNWDARESRILKIRWEADNSVTDEDGESIGAMEQLYLDIENNPDLLTGKRVERVWKTNGNSRISVWETDGAKVENTKALIIRDYVCCAKRIQRFEFL